MRITNAIIQSGALNAVHKSANVKLPAKTTETSKTRSDTVSISGQAQSLSSTQGGQAARAHAEALPEVRENRVAEVRERIANGYYDTPEFADQLVEKLMSQFGVSK